MSRSAKDDNSSSSSGPRFRKNNELKITDTHMMVSELANTEKLVESDKRRSGMTDSHVSERNKGNKENNSDSSDTSSDDGDNLESYINGGHDENAVKMQPFPQNISKNDAPTNLQNVRDQIQLESRKTVEESPEDMRLKKLDMLRKLCELAQAGCILSQNYNMDSDFTTMKYEYEMHTGIRSKHNAVKWMQNLGLNLVYGLEMANEKYNPFDLKLKGWSEVMNSDIDGYYDIFGELYEKYQTPGKPIPPEIKLLFMLSASAIKIHLTHTMASQFSAPQEILSQNPQLAEQLRQQAMVDRLVKEQQNQKVKFEEKLNKQHEGAIKNAMDLKMLNDKKREAMEAMAQNGENIDSNPNQQTMAPPVIPQSLQNKFSPNVNTNVSIPLNQQAQITQPPQFFQSGNMSLQQFSEFRRSEIEQHKNQMAEQFLQDQINKRQNALNKMHPDSIREIASEQSKVTEKFDNFDDMISSNTESIVGKSRQSRSSTKSGTKQPRRRTRNV